MKQYKLIDLVSKGSKARKQIKSDLLVGETVTTYGVGDILDANATEELVTNKVSQIIGNASDALDTLEELGGALPTKVSQLQNDANYTTSTDVAAMVNQLKQQLIDKDILPAIEYVDLGLPSGTKWGNMNVGAKKATDAGKYFSWGNVNGVFAGDTIDFSGGYADGEFTGTYGSTAGAALTTDITQGGANDAAAAALGTPWVMPTKTQFDELINDTYTTKTWTQQNGVNGYLITSKSNGNSIFLPTAGYGGESALIAVGSDGAYWSSSVESKYPEYAFGLYFNSGEIYADDDYRWGGYSVRPVQNGSQA